MSVIPVGWVYASYGAITITAVTIFGILKYNQSPNIYGTLGLILIIAGVILLNIFGKVKLNRVWNGKSHLSLMKITLTR